MDEEKLCNTCKSFSMMYSAGGGAGDGGPLGFGTCERGVCDGQWRHEDDEVAEDFSCSRWESSGEGTSMKPTTLEEVIKEFALKFKKGATDLNDPVTAAMFASELARKIRRRMSEDKETNERCRM